MDRTILQWRPIAVLLVLALIWGANMAAIKIVGDELAPLFMAGLRSLMASACLFTWMRIKSIAIFPSKAHLLHGMVIGFLFGSEFGLIYKGLQYTTASRTYILVYTAPFFVALGAHFLLKGDRLNGWKILGLVLAFVGIVILFKGKAGTFSLKALPGDLMALGAGALWGATTLYIKKFLSKRALPLQTLFYQVCFSAPLLLIMSLLLENPMIKGFSLMTGISVFYQCIVVAFISYLIWFHLIHRYPVSLLHAFSFFTPVFGVFLSGALILGELIRPELLISLGLVSLGMVLVNRQPNS